MDWLKFFDVKRQLLGLILLFFLVLGIFAWIYYKERVFYYDSSFQFFKILYFNTFNIEANRYGTFLTQIPVLIGIKLGLSLKSLTVIFSLTFILIYFTSFLTVVILFKNYFTGLAIGLTLAMGISLGFFHTVTEIHQAMVYSLLFFAWLYLPHTNKNLGLSKPFYLIIGLFFLLISFFSHPTSVFILIYLLGYYLVDTKEYKRSLIYACFAVIFVGLILKFLITDAVSYEGHLFSQFGKFHDLIFRFWTLYSFKFFARHIADIYFFVCLSAIVVIINYVIQKKWIKLVYFVFSLLVFFLLTLLTYHEGNADIAMERVFMPLNVFIAVPFGRDFVLNAKKIGKPVIVYVFLVLISGLFFIYKGACQYEIRTQYLERIIRETTKFEGSKFLILRSQLNMDIIEVPWALSTETILISSINGPLSKTFYCADNENDKIKIKNDNPYNLLVANFWLYWDAGKLNKKYFNLNPGLYLSIDTCLK